MIYLTPPTSHSGIGIHMFDRQQPVIINAKLALIVSSKLSFTQIWEVI